MSRRGALAYLILALLLGGAYLLSTRNQEQNAEQAAHARRVFDIEKGSVSGLALRRAGHPEIRIERAAGGAPEAGGNLAGAAAWRIVAPMQVAADPEAVGVVIDAALAAEKLRTLEGGDLDPSEYGLEKPSLRLSLLARDASHAMEFGGENITGDARYARVPGAPGIFLVAAATYNQADLGLDGLRDRRLMPLDRSAIERISVQWNDARVILHRENGEWRFAKRARPVSDTAVDGLIATVSETNVDRFVTDEAVEPDDYRLGKPDAIVTFEGAGKSWEARFKGPPGDAEEPAVLAARSTAPGIVALPATYLDRLPRSAAALEDQTLLRADAATVYAITLQAGEKKVRFEKEGNAWKQMDAPPADRERKTPPDAPVLLALLGELRHDGAPPRGNEINFDAELSLLLEGESGEPVLDLRVGPANEEHGEHTGRLTDAAGERDILLTPFTLENLQDTIRELAPGLLAPPAIDSVPEPAEAGAP
ncbi:MAG: DUF4340 domain-containing protein [Deltaproteobacteria bacterium]|nr:DUF4340 domain-containing protein [Deltaproteobacteria bacterium]